MATQKRQNPGFRPIAPGPIGLQKMQSVRQSPKQHGARKRKRSSSLARPRSQSKVEDEDRLILTLKDDRALPWRDIAEEFTATTGKVSQVPALQMRYMRLKERLEVWTERDTEALQEAVKYWEERKFKVVSEKVYSLHISRCTPLTSLHLRLFGAEHRHSAHSCRQKWNALISDGQSPYQTAVEASRYPATDTVPAPNLALSTRVQHPTTYHRQETSQFHDCHQPLNGNYMQFPTSYVGRPDVLTFR